MGNTKKTRWYKYEVPESEQKFKGGIESIWYPTIRIGFKDDDLNKIFKNAKIKTIPFTKD